jgi:hypothetical protein
LEKKEGEEGTQGEQNMNDTELLGEDKKRQDNSLEIEESKIDQQE